MFYQARPFQCQGAKCQVISGDIVHGTLPTLLDGHKSCSDVQLHRACVAISTQWAPYKTSDCLHKNEGKNWAACREVGRSVLSGDTPAVQLTLSQQISPLVNILDRGKVFYYHFMGKIWSVIRLVGRPS